MDNRTNEPAPRMWELPAAIATCTAVLGFLALPAGQGIAAWLFADGWVWPTVRTRAGVHPAITAGLGLLAGHPGVGLPAARDQLPPGGLVYLVIGVLEVVIAAAAVVAFTLWYRHIGPGSGTGMASRQQASAVLGAGQLREQAGVLRPDLHKPRKRANR